VKSIKKCKSFITAGLLNCTQKHIKALEIVRSRDKVSCFFFLTHESVWKYDVLYNLMLAHPRFETGTLYVRCDFGRENMLDEMEKNSVIQEQRLFCY
jgi:hypothetical protein